MGALLEAIGERNRPESGVMITALVNYLGENDAGPGFYAYAKRLDRLPKSATRDQQWEFWAVQVTAVCEHYADGGPRHRDSQQSQV
jgi:hypothetical protein